MKLVGLVLGLVCTPAVTAWAEPSGALDLDVSKRGSSYVLRDDAYEIVFPGEPIAGQNEAPSIDGAEGVRLKVARAVYTDDGEFERFLFVLVPVPKDVPFDVKKGLSNAKEKLLQGAEATVVSEEDVTLGGLKAHHVVAKEREHAVYDIYIAWDEPHRVLVRLVASSAVKSGPTQAYKDFIASFKFNANGKAPPRR